MRSSQSEGGRIAGVIGHRRSPPSSGIRQHRAPDDAPGAQVVERGLRLPKRALVRRNGRELAGAGEIETGIAIETTTGPQRTIIRADGAAPGTTTMTKMMMTMIF